MKRYQCMRLYIPKMDKSVATFDAFDEREALEQVNHWNGSMPGKWQYWMTPAQQAGGKPV